jgi:hypothetical protein
VGRRLGTLNCANRLFPCGLRLAFSYGADQIPRSDGKCDYAELNARLNAAMP